MKRRLFACEKPRIRARSRDKVKTLVKIYAPIIISLSLSLVVPVLYREESPEKRDPLSLHSRAARTEFSTSSPSNVNYRVYTTARCANKPDVYKRQKARARATTNPIFFPPPFTPGKTPFMRDPSIVKSRALGK